MTPRHPWDSPGFELPSVATDIGPFASRDFLRVWWRHRAGDGALRLLESDDGFVSLAWWDGAVRFLGEADLTDYHSPLGTGSAELIAHYVDGLEPGTPLRFDSLPAAAAKTVAAGLEASGITVEPEQHEIAAVVALPDTYDGWLDALGRKERHEVRRKLRRFETTDRAPSLTRLEGPQAAASFAALHRSTGGEKGSFMTEDMEAFFADLHLEAGAVIDVLEGSNTSAAAIAFGFEDDDVYYLYNSAYDPEVAELSPGIVLVSMLIRRAIRSGRRRFDFLKGDKAYKFRLGAQRRPLFEIRATKGERR